MWADLFCDSEWDWTAISTSEAAEEYYYLNETISSQELSVFTLLWLNIQLW